MDAYIRQLPHDNEQLNNQWPNIFDALNRLSNNIPDAEQTSFKVKSLDALLDYVLADTEPFEQIKKKLFGYNNEEIHR